MEVKEVNAVYSNFPATLADIVPSGYKQTEVGVLPEDWSVRRLADVAVANWGNTSVTKDRYVDSGFQAYSASGPDGFVSWFEHDYQAVVLSAIGAQCGKTWLASGKWTPIKNTIWFRANGTEANTDFLYRVTGDPSFWPNRGQAQPFIALGDVRDALVPLPPTYAEQRVIAEALSDADALIESLEQLIAKKRQIKQGTMQALLTGKQRLPGFTGLWQTELLQEVADCLDSLRVPLNEAQREKMRGDYPYCGANGVLDFVDDYVIDDDVILIAEDGGYFDEYADRPIAYRMTGKCWVNNHAHILKAKYGFDQGFVFYTLVNKNILSFLASGTRAKLNKSEMNKIEICVPPAEGEQAAIATVLSDMDTELAELETRLAKTRQLKQGMMQELLTGRIRLV
jgi:type I restriction enzyme, S subunit